jgi:hypothetical protein
MLYPLRGTECSFFSFLPGGTRFPVIPGSAGENSRLAPLREFPGKVLIWLAVFGQKSTFSEQIEKFPVQRE